MKIAQAISELADFMNCASGDFHLMHLQFCGEDFDTMHKETLLKYYEQAADDYDELAEWAIAFGFPLENQNFSAKRINYPEAHYDKCKRAEVVKACDEIMDQICTGFNIIGKSLDDSPAENGLNNYIQTRLEYWGKELLYFNKRRLEA